MSAGEGASGEIGEIREVLGGLKSSVDTLRTTWAEQDRKATQGRRELYRKVDELKDEVRDTKGQLERLQEQVKEYIKPAVDRIEVARHERRGARTMIKLIWGLLVGGVAAVAYLIHDWITLFFPPRHP